MKCEYFYLAVNICTILFPLLFSFERKVAFYRWWKYLFPAIVLTAVPFIIFDNIYTGKGIWAFNANYITGIEVFHLPIEEVLFFFTIPYACLYIYVALNTVFKDPHFFERYKNVTSLIVTVFCFLLAIIFHNRPYTFVISLAAGLFLLLAAIVIRVKFIAKFWRSFFVQLIPFIIVNGLLTGTLLDKNVFIYDENSIANIRILTIPVEDVLFSLLLLLMNVSLLELFKQLHSTIVIKPVQRYEHSL